MMKVTDKPPTEVLIKSEILDQDIYISRKILSYYVS